ncbi:hypothetical protein QLL71_000946 [Salmonella enterica]|nr:hypothetical protein [Salmonella enterica]HEC7332306.1 hypothetical protein [Salmonella enterica subsp. enterica serovar Newport]EHK8993838.1 hypothetical protein [Salmonella enterica]ELG6426515.1 hypothetical protein [Salmonella enterica]ELG6471503.1 hypothetical protein [Salmonella enterica]ELW7418701.1 hypothetical protein [Salmonella enterica]
MQAVRADSETAVVWLSARNEAERGRKGCFARRERHERESAKQAAQSGMV